jgi:hypothetical protein
MVYCKIKTIINIFINWRGHDEMNGHYKPFGVPG